MAKEEVKEEVAKKAAEVKEKVEKVAEKVKDDLEEAHSIAEGVKEAVKENVAEKVADAKEEIAEKVADAKEEIAEKVADAKESYAKSGKKSKKHIEEVKAEEERQERKKERAEKEAAVKPKGAAPVTRPRIERRGKKYQEAARLVKKGEALSLKDAVALAIKTNPAKFDASVEIHARLGVDPRQADQNIRTTLVLPNGNGKSVRVAVFAPLDIAKAAKAAGADIAEDEEFLKRLDKGTIDFDVLILRHNTCRSLVSTHDYSDPRA